MASARAVFRAALALCVAAVSLGKPGYYCVPKSYLANVNLQPVAPACRSIPAKAYATHGAPRLDPAAVSCKPNDPTAAVAGICKGKVYTFTCRFLKGKSHAIITSVGYATPAPPAATAVIPAGTLPVGAFSSTAAWTSIFTIAGRAGFACNAQRVVLQKGPNLQQAAVTFTFTVPCTAATTKAVRIYVSSSALKNDYFHTTAFTYKIKAVGCACAGR